MSGITVGVDVGGTKIQAVALPDEGVAGSARVPTPLEGVEALVAAIAEGARTALAAAGSGGLAAVGIGMPGTIDTAAGTVANSPNMPGFERATPVALARMVSEALGGVPVKMGNDVDVAVLGEHRLGAGRPYRDLLGVWVGTGVGGGLILGGQPHRGGGAAGELGHMLVKPEGRLCSCGRRGHLEAYAGRGQMEARARQLESKGRRTILFRLAEKRGKPRVSSSVWLEAIERGDRLAIRLVDDAVWALGVALASVQNLLDLEAIVIGGGLGDRLGVPFLERVAEAMRPQLFVSERPPAMLPTAFRDLSGAVGAAVLARE